MSLHRLFVALRPPRVLRSALIAAMHGVSGARWQSDDQLHLTLKFIGEVDHHQAEDIAAALGMIHAPPVTLALSGVGSFSRKDSPHTLWAGVTPHAPLVALHHKVEQACARAGIAPEPRAYQPHITLARLNRSAGPVAPFIALHADLHSLPADIGHVTLFESTLGHGGARYEPVARYPLD